MDLKSGDKLWIDEYGFYVLIGEGASARRVPVDVPDGARLKVYVRGELARWHNVEYVNTHGANVVRVESGQTYGLGSFDRDTECEIISLPEPKG